ncbi:AraC family transcriptional regulator [Cohnella caldifontis]|uniref:AraC family transcriptional regulator n=1 Tax=Cohnella caldifontis TaxID=3027471 RepID=UPI0023EB6783|nr:AraC family transcriptional regulator [Cohnella sp. YIM B05605]
MRMLNEHAVSSATKNVEESLDATTARLASLIYAHTPHDGVFSQRISGLYLSRFSQITMDSVKSYYLPSLSIVAQGAKSISMGQEVFPFGRSQMFVFPVALPIAIKATQASDSEPLLGFRLELSPQKIAELVLKVFPKGLPPVRQRSAGYVTCADLGVVDAAKRLMDCLSNPGDGELLAPLVMDEILIRVLRSPIGVHVAEMGITDSGVQRVAKAIAWLRENYSHQMKVSELAELVHMSESSFREHFKSVTSMSPLQYQKALRLHEARRLMVTGSVDATTACRLVGYVSASQFNRDYSRFFGSPPRRDVARLR